MNFMKTSKPVTRNLRPEIIGLGVFILVFFNLLVAYGQNWPVSFDGAAALKPAQLEISPYGAGSYYASEHDGGTIGYTPGLKFGIGIVRNFDVKLSYERSFYKLGYDNLEDSKQNNLSIMPKVSFFKEHLAFQLPFSVILFNSWAKDGNKLDAYYSFNPRIIVSFRYKQYVEFNLAPSFEIGIPGHGMDPSYMVGGSIGFAFSSNLLRWSVRPAGFIDYLIPQKGSTSDFIIYGWGLSFTYNINLIKKEPEKK